MSTRVRLAGASDVPVILAFIRELAEFERLGHEVVATEESLRETLFGARPCAQCLLAEEGGKAQGFALFFTSYSTFLSRPGIYLEDLYVRPEARGKGVGEALLLELARLAVERKCGRLEWAVLRWNEGAIRFYERLGARPLEEWVTYRLTGEALERAGRSPRAITRGAARETLDVPR